MGRRLGGDGRRGGSRRADARPTSAQDRPWTGGAAVGGARLWDDEGTLGPGPAFVGTVGRSVTGRLSAEATLLVASHDRRTPFISWEGDGLALLSRGVFHVRGPRYARVRSSPAAPG